jgi:hypothetical protein
VENKKGFRVEHLKKEDFTFFDNGEPQGIALFFHRIGDAPAGIASQAGKQDCAHTERIWKSPPCRR